MTLSSATVASTIPQSDAEIDAKVARIMQHGSKPSGPATSPPPMESPKDVRDARRAVRREQKRRLRRYRRNNP